MQRNAMTQPRRGIRGGGWLSSAALDDVEDGEEEDPDDIYKVPIETNVIERRGPPRSVISCEELAEEAPRDQQNADEDMRAVKACHYEKAGTVDSVLVEPKAFVVEVIPLPRLHRKED
jgi:hypothetical protein